jgi:hypothetical protein
MENDMTGLTDANQLLKPADSDDATLTEITSRLMGAAYSITDVRKRRLVADALIKILRASLELDDGPADEPMPVGERKRGRPRKSTDGPVVAKEGTLA